MMSRAMAMAKDTLIGFFADDALSRAAAIAYFTLFSIGPLLFIASGVAGLVFGDAMVRDALNQQLTGLLGDDAGRQVDAMAQGALGEARGGWAVFIGAGTLLLTASGAFGALQGALNAVWKVETPTEATTAETITGFVRAKAAAMGLVATTGFLLLVSLSINAALSVLGTWLTSLSPAMETALKLANEAVSLGVTALLFAAIYKILPDRRLAWRDVMIGALATAVLFTAGKTLIGLYIGASGAAAGFGAAGTIVVVLLWIYYSAVIFLLGAEFTRAWSGKEAALPEDAALPRAKVAAAIAAEAPVAKPGVQPLLLTALGACAIVAVFARR
ncbi:YihY/virulence factor BrkB family protein [Humitalea sp. 24SJ18S-53]|uniref:YihY/virulence factor BrkB family protein n=1 Tax=Humitalea sp. 24SJ18S-53 TaxID=3422307 RepID=UPI003D67D10E